MRTTFLYPFRLNIGHQDLAWFWASGIHIVSALILLIFVPAGLALCLSVLGAISLRSIWDSQTVIRKSVILAADTTGQWYLESRNGGRDNVRLKSICLCLSLIIVEIERFGSRCYVVEFQSRLSDEQVHRVKLLSQYFAR